MNIKVLDHGYVRLIEAWGSDIAIIEAARQSTDGAFRGWGPSKCRTCRKSETPGTVDYQGGLIQCPDCKGKAEIPGDERLLARLWHDKHYTPFEMAGLAIEVQAPIFVTREWQRHRTQSYSEMSGRYVKLLDFGYVPSLERIMAGKQSRSNKQGSESGIPDSSAATIRQIFKGVYKESYAQYEHLMEEYGLSRELAARILPLTQYTRMRTAANLRNWLAFLTLRIAPDAQFEIRCYANAVGTIIADRFPRTWELFNAERTK